MSKLTYDRGAEASFPYDPASQVTNILHQLTATSAPINQAAYAYNPVGNRTSLTDRRGSQAFGYDTLDRLTSASHPLLATPQAFAYDAVGNRTTGGSVVNVGNQLTADINFGYQYDDNGNLTRKTLLATGNFTSYTYDAENRLTKVEEFAAGNPTAALTSTYRYDGLGRRIEKVANGQTTRYIYDGEDILLEYDGANVLQARYTHGPGIDEPLSRTPMTPGVGSGHTAVLASTPDGVTGPVVDDGIRVNGQVSIGFVFVSGPPTPAIGQPLTATGSHAPVPLIDVTTASATGTLTVDLIDTGGIGGNAPLYLVVRDHATTRVVSSQQLFAARPTFASTTPIGTPLVVASTHVSTVVAGATLFYHQDGLGTVTDLTDSAGATAKSYAYDAYGTIVDQPYTYTGREFDSESGLYYYRNRHLDATTGRFLQKDPQFTFRGGDLNIYRYAKINPILRRDPFGLFSVSGCCGNEDTVRNEVRGSCSKVTNNISNPPLMACVLKRCADATLECEKDCDPPTLGYNRSFLGIRSSTIHVCTNTAPPWKYGEIAIHEWAHSCGWDHGEGSGVPGDSGVTDIQDRDPVWAPDAK